MSDAISRDEIMKELESLQEEYGKGAPHEYDVGAFWGLDDAIDIVREAQACDVMPKWISTKDRLPEEPGEVLMVLFGRVCVAWYFTDGKFEAGSGMVWSAPDCVEYWMPLPEPPAAG